MFWELNPEIIFKINTFLPFRVCYKLKIMKQNCIYMNTYICVSDKKNSLKQMI